MAATPSLTRFPSFPVIGGLGLLAIGFFVLLQPSTIDPYVMDLRALEDQPWRLLTSCLLHAGQLRSPQLVFGLLHLGFNLYWLWILGSVIEEGFGHLRTGILVILVGVAGSALEYGLAGSAVGLSGVVYGLAGFAFVLERRVPKYRGIMDATRLRLLLGWFILCIGMTIGGVMPIANFAHGAGAVVGMALAFGSIQRGPRSIAALSGAALTLLAGLLFASVLRPTVNFTRGAGADAFDLGSKAFDAGDYHTAARRFEQATVYRRTFPEAWANLAMSRDRIGDKAGANEAWAKLAEAAPDDPRWDELIEGRDLGSPASDDVLEDDAPAESGSATAEKR